MEKDVTQHGIHQKVVASNKAAGIRREEQLFGETGLLSLGLSMMGAGGAAGLLGLSRKRPQDVTAAEMESAIATVKGESVEELSAKEKQFAQLVKGIGEFMATNPAGGEVLKPIMDKCQDAETKVAVATVKKNGVVV
jgi:hypothetical protein